MAPQLFFKTLLVAISSYLKQNKTRCMWSEVYLVCCSTIVRRKQCLVHATAIDMSRMSLARYVPRCTVEKVSNSTGQWWHTPLVLKTEAREFEFRISLGCRAITRTAWSSQRNPVLKKEKQKRKKKATTNNNEKKSQIYILLLAT